MPRRGYGMNIRPIYDDNEPTAGDYLTSGISGAIEEWQTRSATRQAEAEAARQEQNKYTAEGFTPVPRGEERLAPTAQMRPAARGIGAAIGQTMPGMQGLEQPAAGAGYESVVSRSGQTLRRPGAAMRQQQEQARDIDTYRKREDIRVAGERSLIPLRNARSRAGMTQTERVEIENLRQQGRLAIQAMVSGRGNSAMQLQAAKAVQASLDGRVRAAQQRLIAAQRAYDNDAAADAADALEAAQQAADSYRDELRAIESGGDRPRSPAHAPEDPRSAAARRARPRQAPRSGTVQPPLPLTPAPSGGRRTVPPPIRP